MSDIGGTIAGVISVIGVGSVVIFVAWHGMARVFGWYAKADLGLPEEERRASKGTFPSYSDAEDDAREKLGDGDE